MFICSQFAGDLFAGWLARWLFGAPKARDQPTPAIYLRSSHACHHLSQSGVRDITQYACNDPAKWCRARDHRISEDTAEQRPAGGAAQGDGYAAARAAAKEGDALC